jgi:CTP:phosphocholine cytidylyltransferase-like protein
LLWKSRVRITEALQTRLAAINTSTIADDVKYNAKQVVETQIEQFQNSSISTVVALSSFIHQTVPQLLDDVDAVRNMTESDHSFYMYNMHDNFGAYAAIFDQLDKDLKD